jgi:hypothetical protein
MEDGGWKAEGLWGSFMHGVHHSLDPLCEATRDVDLNYGFGPCTSAKGLLLVALHVVLFLFLFRNRKERPLAYPKVTAQEQAGYVEQTKAEASSSAVRSGDASGLTQRAKGKV